MGEPLEAKSPRKGTDQKGRQETGWLSRSELLGTRQEPGEGEEPGHRGHPGLSAWCSPDNVQNMLLGFLHVADSAA